MVSVIREALKAGALARIYSAPGRISFDAARAARISTASSGAGAALAGPAAGPGASICPLLTPS